MTKLSKTAAALLEVRGDFETYAENCLIIADKVGALIPLKLNRAQRYLHARVEKQRAEVGFIRAIVLKGRQQGLSTYIGGRFYWKASGEFSKRTFILTHMQDATDNLFGMVKRYHDNVPHAVRPSTKLDNAKELFFDKLQSRYSVATAGSRSTGRSATAQYFHGSEVAFWPGAEKHMAGIGQIIPLETDTEIILESTANGIGNLYHRMVLDAMRGRGDYIFVFIPWYWEEKYRRKVPRGTVFDPEELEYQELFGIDDEQLYWRQRKIIDDFKSDETLFDQEYPATPEMAFYAGTSRALIKPSIVARAVVNASIKDDSLDALILGVDPAEYGDDDTAAVLRRGHKVLKIWRWHNEGNAQIAGRVSKIIDDYADADDPIDGVCVDVTGVGTGVEAFLTDKGYTNIYRVHNGEAAYEDEQYRNRGAECWSLMKDWLEDKTRQASLPQDFVLQAELSSRTFTYDARRRVVLQSKEQMRKEGIPSPNTADALALTFAERLKAKTRRRQGETLEEKLRRLARKSGSPSGGVPGMSA